MPLPAAGRRGKRRLVDAALGAQEVRRQRHVSGEADAPGEQPTGSTDEDLAAFLESDDAPAMTAIPVAAAPSV
ncbi:MAG: hypothetical protein ACK40H_05315, partial [Sphingomonadaceae bacterium]